MNPIGINDILLITPFLALFLTSIIPITIKVLRGNAEQPAAATLIQGLGGLLATFVLMMIVSGAGKTAFMNTLVFDRTTTWMSLIALGSAAMAILMMYDNPATSGHQFSELIFLALNSTLGMLILISATDLLTVFIGLEIMSLALYMMIGMSHEQKLSKEAAFKYFILGSFASAIFLYGISFVFGSAGSTYLIDLVQKTPELVATNKLFIFGITMVILGFCFKVSIAPFHAWTPDVYQGAPTPHTAFMATAVKTVSFAAFLRILGARPLIGNENIFDFLQWLAVITMIVGNVAAILQNNFKRMLAYSSISNSGYILVGLITAGVSDNFQEISGTVMFYLFSYSAMTLGAFAIVNLIEKNENSSVMIDDLAGYAKKNPFLAFCLTLFLLSLAGIPPLIGFFGKFYLFTAAVGEGLIWLALWGVINSVISVYYYLRPVVVMYMKDGAHEAIEQPMNSSKSVVVITAFIVLVLGLISGPILQIFSGTF